ncbi:hypothetical protein RHS01_05976 [Rhizoctonia solani]|uniref:Uncharacterized protein n=1 Tax=Rhizoctonia solani TaxID=456999 RepID=A0A8H7IFX6_9AGAM|nr:hypothetical protein RHS01_05976 [Rhizoctonia solani]
MGSMSHKLHCICGLDRPTVNSVLLFTIVPNVDFARIAQSLAIAPSATATFAALGTRFAFETAHGRSPTPGSDEDYVLLEQCFNTLIGGDAGEEGKIALGEL